ncbi:MAG: CinA family protein [Chloroflexi bacterium]|nr:CinA family protein [Chloroflexota bacterium]
MSHHESLLKEVTQKLLAKRWTISVAEVDTGGLIGDWLISIPGASQWFRGGVIAYTGITKEKILGVPGPLLREKGHVSPEVVVEMAKRVRELADTDVAISDSGVAGPTGGHSGKPIGLFYIGFAARDGTTEAIEWRGTTTDRTRNREGAAVRALEAVRDYLNRV